jgi:hypothetical protein
MDQPWWLCERCRSLNPPGTSTCYSCRTPAAQTFSTNVAQGVPPDWGQAGPRLLPQSYGPAGMGRRIGAWILDTFLLGLLTFVPFILALVLGAVAINPEALDQFSQITPGAATLPFADITVPLFTINVTALIAAAAVYLAIDVAYFAGCWIWFGGTPAQRALGLRVADVTSGENMSIDQSLLRWALLQGISTVIGAISIVVVLNAMATTPMNELFSTTDRYSVEFSRSLGAVGAISNLVSWGSSIWMIALVVSAGTNSLRRGLHDRIVGSIVLRPVSSYPAWPVGPDQPHPLPYGPQGDQGWPAYPPAPGPGHWPPEAPR